MTIYRLKSTGEINPHITADIYAAWVAAGHPKADAYEAFEPAPEPEPEPTDQEIWQEKLAGTINVNGLELKASINSRDTFTGQFVLLSSAKQMGYIQGDSIQSIWDANNIEHHFTVDELLGILLTYGFKWSELFNLYAP